MSKLVRERRFEDFAAKFHPLDLAKFKNVILAIVDLAHDISDAEQFCSQFDRYIQRKEIVEIPPDQVFATYCQAVLFPDVESQADIAATDDAWQYCGVVVEDDETLHVLYLSGTTLAYGRNLSSVQRSLVADGPDRTREIISLPTQH
jgi:hypothetical protein